MAVNNGTMKTVGVWVGIIAGAVGIATGIGSRFFFDTERGVVLEQKLEGHVREADYRHKLEDEQLHRMRAAIDRLWEASQEAKLDRTKIMERLRIKREPQEPN